MEGGVKTVEQARALPEIRDELFESWTETLSDGTTICKSKARPFVCREFSEDDIIAFVDKDGRFMKVTYTENGPAKVEFRL